MRMWIQPMIMEKDAAEPDGSRAIYRSNLVDSTYRDISELGDRQFQELSTK